MPQAESSDRQAENHLVVDAGHPAAEILLLDHKLGVIDRAIGRLETHQPDGVYRAKVVLGRQVEERAILLEHDTAESMPVHDFASPAPFAGGLQTPAVHVAAAQRECQTVRLEHGTGSQLFFFARLWEPGTTPLGAARNVAHPARGFSLWTAGGGKRIVDLERQAVGGQESEGWAACNLSVRPGPYTLRFTLSGFGTIDQTLMATAGWQTQVFVLRSPPPVAEQSAIAGSEDSPDITILMSRSGFDGTDDDTRLTEIARLALTDDRRIMSGEMRALLSGKLENPMLGLYEAHLMLAAHARAHREQSATTQSWPSFNEETELGEGLATVIANLVELLGRDHPDVAALALQLDDSQRPTPKRVVVPPMLRASWSLLVAATNDHPELLDPKVWQRIKRLTATRPFLTWVVTPKGGNRQQGDEALAAAVQQRVAATEQAPEPRPRALENDEVARSPGETAAAMMFPPVAMIRSPAAMISPAAARMSPPAAITSNVAKTRRDISIELDIPRFAVDDALATDQ